MYGRELQRQDNYRYRYEENVTRTFQVDVDEFEQISVKQRKAMEKQITDLDNRLSESETNRKRYRNERDLLRRQLDQERLKQARSQKNSAEREEHLKKDIEKLKNKFEQKQREWAKKVKNSENACHEIIRTHEKENEQLEKEIIHRDIEMVNLRKNLETSEVAFNELMMSGPMNSEHLINTENRLEKALTKLSLTAKELEEMKTSKTMDSRLKEKESNGSNKHSPSKLSERYAELYDNQWTDAYEHLERYFHRDEDIIQALLTILQDMVEFCTEKSKTQIEKLQRTLTFSDTQAGGHVPQNIAKQLKDLRKSSCTVSKESLYKLYISSLQKTTNPYMKRALEIRFFVDDCFEICWLMAIQDPFTYIRQKRFRSD